MFLFRSDSGKNYINLGGKVQDVGPTNFLLSEQTKNAK